MLNKNRTGARAAFLLTAALTLAGGCAVSPELVVTGEAVLNSAVENGYLMPAEQISDDGGQIFYELAEAAVGDFTREYAINARLYAPVQRDLSFERDGGRLKEIYVTTGERVKKGDVLAELEFEQEALTADRAQLMLAIRQFESQHADEDARRINQIEQARGAAAQNMSVFEAERLALSLSKLELEYAQYTYRNNLTREDYNRRLADIDERLTGERILAPFDGIVVYIANVRAGYLVRNRTRVLSVVDESLIQFIMEGPIDVLRYGDTFRLTGARNAEFIIEVRVVSDSLLADIFRRSQASYLAEPVDMNALYQLVQDMNLSVMQLYSMTLTAQPTAYAVADVLYVPKRAVRMEDRRHFVSLYEDGMIKKRYVQLGLDLVTDVQILDGLESGQRVVLFN